MEQVIEVFKKNRPLFEDLVKRKFIYTQTAEIYGGTAGLFDYGPIGCGIKNNLIQKWKKHFIVEEDLLEIATTTLTPAIVFKYSGHEARFNDFMCKDEKTQDTFRVDHLVEDYLGKKIADKKTPENEREQMHEVLRKIPDLKECAQFDELINKYQIKNPQNGNELSKTYEFNLMFSSTIGPLGNQKAYLRPETAQGIFTNFQKLLTFNNGQLPFGGATIGNAYRNEIAARNGLLRVREFEMAEIEYFIDPISKKHPKFQDVCDLVVPLYDRKSQEEGPNPRNMSLKDGVEQGIIANEMIGYFLGRIYLFMKDLGIKEDMLRFRQHLSGEMAHYACDCWDTELLCSYGWIESVGLADRSAYDLTAHTNGSGIKLQASRVLPTPEEREFLQYKINRQLIGKTFKKEAKQINDDLENLSEEDLQKLKEELEKEGKSKVGTFELTSDMLTDWKVVKKIVQEEKFTPSVIEPSFGLGRIIYCLLEQSFLFRENDVQRSYFKFKHFMAPYKCVFLPLMRKDELVEVTMKLEKEFRTSGIMCRSDCGSSAIGKRYARTDEMGIPYAITIDYDTLSNQTVTVRDLDTMKQIRVPIHELKETIQEAIEKDLAFEELIKKYPQVTENQFISY